MSSQPVFLTAEECDLDRADPFIAAIDEKLAAFAEFKAHTDYFDPAGLDFDVQHQNSLTSAHSS